MLNLLNVKYVKYLKYFKCQDMYLSHCTLCVSERIYPKSFLTSL